MHRLPILCLTAAFLLSTGCRKTSASTTSFTGVYIEQNSAVPALVLNFLGNGKVIVSGGKLNNQTWTSTTNTFNLKIDSPRLFFIDPANPKNSAEYWYNTGTKDGARTLVLSPCAPGVPCVLNYYFVQQP